MPPSQLGDSLSPNFKPGPAAAIAKRPELAADRSTLPISPALAPSPRETAAARPAAPEGIPPGFLRRLRRTSIPERARKEAAMPVYLELFHGTESPDRSQLDGWGEQGPILGPLAYVHTTYAGDLKCCPLDPDGKPNEFASADLQVTVECLLFYDGMYVFLGYRHACISGQMLQHGDRDLQATAARSRIAQFTSAARLDRTRRRLRC